MRRFRRRRKSNYLLPFLALISVGVILILGFQIFGGLFGSQTGDAVYYTADGRSKTLAFGQAEWETTYNGVKIKLGDSVKTLKNAKGVISFYDGTVVRLDEDTEVKLTDITKNDDDQKILLSLNRGSLWVNKPKERVIDKTDFVIQTDYAAYSITGTVFALEKKTSSESLRVMKGEVQVDITEEANGEVRVIENMAVGIGQEVNLDDAVMQAFYNRESPSVKKAISPDFRDSSWFKWNEKEDLAPTDYTGQVSSASPISDPSDDEDEAEEDDADEAEKSDLAVPTISSPEETSIVSEEDEFEIRGVAAEGTQKVLVVQLLAGEVDEEKVLLNNYDADELNFSYDISLAQKNIKSGKNVYRFIGVDENARETEAVTVEIEYLGEDATEESEDEEDDSANNAVGELSKPTVSKVAGKNYSSGMDVEDSAFSISGTISGADSVWVNDYQLSQFKEGDSEWTYNVNADWGNLEEGENEYEVYGTNFEGEKSEIVTIRINYTGEIEEEAAPVVEEEESSPEVSEGF